jgi:broad specificity phosphatase PhoE
MNSPNDNVYYGRDEPENRPTNTNGEKKSELVLTTCRGNPSLCKQLLETPVLREHFRLPPIGTPEEEEDLFRHLTGQPSIAREAGAASGMLPMRLPVETPPSINLGESRRPSNVSNVISVGSSFSEEEVELATGEPHRTTVSILFVRHSESCANLLKRASRPTDQARYTDPELTQRGIGMARERGGQLATLIPQVLGGPTRGPLFYGASILRRTQQTAQHLLAGGAPAAEGGVIHVLPYISEVGLGYDNTPGDRDTQAGRVDFASFDEAGPDAGKPNPRKFFEWLGTKTREPAFLELFSTRSRPTSIRMVIVTHAGWMQEMAKLFSATVPRYENLDAAGVTLIYGNDGVIQTPPAWIDAARDAKSHLPYTGTALTAPACPDNCKGAVICSGQTGSLCGRLQAIYEQTQKGEPVPWTLLGDLAKDMGVESLYATGGRQVTLKEGAALLNKYAPSVGFGRTRERRYLLADVRDLLTQLTCEGAPSGQTEACAAVTELLDTPEGAENSIENWKISLASNRLLNAKDRNLLRNYSKKGILWGRRKSRRGLRRNLQTLKQKVCPAASMGGGGRRTHHKKRATRKRR